MSVSSKKLMGTFLFIIVSVFSITSTAFAITNSNPADASLYAWYDMTSLYSDINCSSPILVGNADTPVSCWKNKSSITNPLINLDLKNSDVNKQPIYLNFASNSPIPGVDFDGVNQYLEATSSSLSDWNYLMENTGKGSNYIVYRSVDASGPAAPLYSTAGSSGTGRNFILVEGSNFPVSHQAGINTQFYNATAFQSGSSSSLSSNFDNAHINILSEVFDNTTSPLEYTKVNITSDGFAQDSTYTATNYATSPSTNVDNRLRIGGNGNGDSLFGTISAILMYNKKLSCVEDRDVKGYLMNYVSLPSGTTYHDCAVPTLDNDSANTHFSDSSGNPYLGTQTFTNALPVPVGGLFFHFRITDDQPGVSSLVTGVKTKTGGTPLLFTCSSDNPVSLFEYYSDCYTTTPIFLDGDYNPEISFTDYLESYSNTGTATNTTTNYGSTVLIDTTAPALTSITASPTSGSTGTPITLSLNWNEATTGTVNITIDGTSVSVTCTAQTTCTGNYTPTTSGAKSISIISGTATDALANSRTSSFGLTLPYGPVVTIQNNSGRGGGSSTVYSCSDSKDNDGDGRIDRDDADCYTSGTLFDAGNYRAQLVEKTPVRNKNNSDSLLDQKNLFSGLGGGALCEPSKILTQNLTTGAKNGKYHFYTRGTVNEAKILQEHMNRLGFNSGPNDGIIGPLTRGAIMRMQQFLGTKQDAYVGPITRSLINNSCNP